MKNNLHLTEPLNLDHLKELYNTDIKSEDASEFPLWALLTIYEKANTVSYKDYMKGFKLLTDWLTPISAKDLHITWFYPEALCSYETQQLASILNVDADVIIHCLVTKVTPRLDINKQIASQKQCQI